MKYTELKQSKRTEYKVVINPNTDEALTMLEEIAIMNGKKPEKKEAIINRLVEEYANKAIDDLDYEELAKYTQLTKKADAGAQELATKIIPVKIIQELNQGSEPKKGRKNKVEQEQEVNQEANQEESPLV